MRSIFCVLLLVSTPCFAYNWNRCKTSAVYKHTDRPTKPNEGLFEATSNATAYLTTEKTVGGLASATSYVSSTGPCKAIGMADEQRINYIAETQIDLQIELAEGSGDHLTSLATLYGCNAQAQSQFTQIMKAHHSQIFSNGSNSNPVELKNKITDTLISSDILRDNCNPEKI